MRGCVLERTEIRAKKKVKEKLITLRWCGGLERTEIRAKIDKEKSIICSFSSHKHQEIDIEICYHRENEHSCQWGIFAAEVSSHNCR